MVEKKEFVILFIKKNISEVVTEFIPHRVVEGIYDKENNWFNDTKDAIPYLHIDKLKCHMDLYCLMHLIHLVA